MHSLALPCLAMCAVNLYLGAYHLVLFLNRRQAREHLPFALTCLSVTAYDLFSVGLYNATSLEQGIFWQRLQLHVVIAITLSILWFSMVLSGHARDRMGRFITGWFALLLPLTLIEAPGLTLSESTPAIKSIVWGGQHLITYFESDVGVFLVVEIVSAILTYVYVLVILYRHYRQERSRHVLGMLIAQVTYFAGTINDSLVTLGVYRFIYVVEYTFLTIVLSMAYVLLKKFVDSQVSLEYLNANLEATVVQRTSALSAANDELQQSLDRQTKLQRQLIEVSRRAGMAEVAISVLHNVGNVLNGITVSINVLDEWTRSSKTGGLSRAVQLLRDHESDLPGFFAHDDRARHLPAYLGAIDGALAQEQQKYRKELESLRKNVGHIEVIVSMQQAHARAEGVAERLSLASLLEDALSLTLVASGRADVALEREYEALPEVEVDRHKLLQIVVNLMKNAVDAVEAAPSQSRRIAVRLRRRGGEAEIEVEDGGCGIAAEDLTRIFHHGFTTKKRGHGFGLHSSACAAKEMGGSLSAHSAGLGRGASFRLVLPLLDRSAPARSA